MLVGSSIKKELPNGSNILHPIESFDLKNSNMKIALTYSCRATKSNVEYCLSVFNLEITRIDCGHPFHQKTPPTQTKFLLFIFNFYKLFNFSFQSDSITYSLLLSVISIITVII